MITEKGTSSVWKISSSTYNISNRVKKYIDDVYSKIYATKEEVSTNFLDIDGSNAMRGSIKMLDGANIKLKLTTDGLEDTNNNNSIHFIDGSINIVAENKISLSAVNEIEIGKTANYIYIGSTNASSNIHIYGCDMLLQSQDNLDIGAVQQLYITTDNKNIDISSGENIILNAKNREKDISMNAKNIYFNDIKLTPPTPSDVSHMLAVTNNNGEYAMTWNNIGGMKLKNFNTPGEEDEFSFIETAEQNILCGTCVSFSGSGGSRHAIIGYNTIADINIASIGGKTLDGTHDISVMTINGKSVVGTSDAMTFVLDNSFNEYKKNLVHFNGDPNGSNMLFINRNNSDEYVITESSEITVSGGSLQAKAFVMSSDRNLKTDIREDCFAKELPAIHGFKWKDTSVQSYGFIAQELEEAGFDHLVINGRNGKGVDYMAALSYKVAQLERENQMLKQSISDLYDKLNNK